MISILNFIFTVMFYVMRYINYISLIYVFLNKLITVLNIYCPFVTAESIVLIFFIFWPNKIRISPTDVVSSLFPLRCRLSFDRRRHAAASCHASLPLSQDEITTSTSSFGNASSRPLPSQAEIETLNLHHRRRLPFQTSRLPTFTVIKRS
jgi:hypothetical protein